MEMAQNKTELEKLIDFGDEADLNTKPENQCDKTFESIWLFAFGAIGTVILIGNSFTCIVFVTSTRLRENVINIFLLSLACLDVLMACLVIPFYAIHCSLGCEYSLVEYCWLFRKAKDFVLMGATFNVCAITYDRYLAVLRPLHYGAKMTKRRITVILLGIWTLPAVVAGIRSAWHHTKKEEELRYVNKVYDTILVAVFVVFLVLAMLVVNIKIMRAIKKHSDREVTEQSRRKRWPKGKALRQNNTDMATRSKGTTACLLVVFIFLVCWLPRIVYNFSYIINPPGLASPLFFRIGFFCLFIQSSSNPFIYSFYRSEFRRAALKLIRCRFVNRINPILVLPAPGTSGNV